MRFSNIQLQVWEYALTEFKNEHAINGRGYIFNYKAGAEIYDYMMNEDEHIKIVINISELDKKKLWKKAKTGILITQYDIATSANPNNEMRKKVEIQIYKTLLLECHLNQLADNGQFIDLGLKKILK